MANWFCYSIAKMLSKKKYFFLAISFFLLALFFQLKSVQAQYMCNQSCDLNPAGCNAPLTCSGGLCRNPASLGDATCAGVIETPGPTEIPTSTPASTPASTPTPTTVPADNPWIKIRDSSFYSPASLTNIIPLSITAYDSDDDAAQRYFIMTGSGSDPGLVSNSSTDTGTADVSSRKWKTDYTQRVALAPGLFTQYIKSRKDYHTISDLSLINEDGVYVWQVGIPFPEITSVPAKFNSYNVLLIVSDTVSINMDNFNPTKSIAIMASTIDFSSTVSQATGIFIANDVSLGITDDKGLKINGNLIVTQTGFTNSRQWSDMSKPSLFIVFKPSIYIDLLPYLSTASYQWSQIQ